MSGQWLVIELLPERLCRGLCPFKGRETGDRFTHICRCAQQGLCCCDARLGGLCRAVWCAVIRSGGGFGHKQAGDADQFSLRGRLGHQHGIENRNAIDLLLPSHGANAVGIGVVAVFSRAIEYLRAVAEESAMFLDEGLHWLVGILSEAPCAASSDRPPLAILAGEQRALRMNPLGRTDQRIEIGLCLWRTRFQVSICGALAGLCAGFGSGDTSIKVGQ